MVQATPLNLLVKSHLALLLCNIIWACDYPFYNLVLSKYVAPIALVTASLCAAALFSLVPLLWSKAKPIARKDIKTMIGAALLIGVIRKVLLMYGLSRTSPIDGSIIDTITPLLVLLISVVQVCSEAMLWRTVRAGFALRRKTLVNSLQTGFPLPKDQLAAIVTGCGLPENVRGERLSLADYAALANALAAVM